MSVKSVAQYANRADSSTVTIAVTIMPNGEESGGKSNGAESTTCKLRKIDKTAFSSLRC